MIQFGVGGLARPGDWIGMQIGVTDRASRPRSLRIRALIPDPDGDIAQIQLDLTSSPGQEVPVWLYARIPFLLGANPTIPIQALEVPDGTEADAVVPGTLAGSLAHQAGLRSATLGFIAVVGKNDARLDQYNSQISQNEWSPLHHELTEKPPLLNLADLPDRWMGLAPFGTIIWTARDAEGDPARLTDSQRQALADWVRRGGHLVIVPATTDSVWLNPAANPLIELMPLVKARRGDLVDLNPLRAFFLRPPPRVFEHAPPPALPLATSVQTFAPADGAAEADAMAIIPSPVAFTLAPSEGTPAPPADALVTRRLVGIGAVTLVGVDLLSPAMAATDFEADVFWHRILGRRGQLEDTAGLQRLATGSTTTRSLSFSNRSDRYYDRGIPGSIAKTGRAAAGLLIAFAVFGIYWLIAGPGGFALLKRFRKPHHAWLSFVVLAGFFTALAWGTASYAKPREVEGQHLTILDHVFGQPNQRARMWLSLLLPQHGTARVRVADDPRTSIRAAIAPWDPPADSLLGNPAFPDARAYAVNARDPSSIRVPTRATVKQFQVDWAAGPTWRMPLPVRPAGGGAMETGGVIRLADRARSRSLIEGTLVHNLPGPLSDVTLIVVTGQELRKNTAAGALLANASAFRFASDRTWKPGEPLDLATLTVDQAASPIEQYFETLVPPVATAELAPSIADRRDTLFPERLGAVAFLPLLQPPDLTQLGQPQPLARQRLTHNLDLARWFTQPCVILLAHLPVGPTPIPLTVDDRPADAIADQITGRTLIRWIYPLPSLTAQPPPPDGLPIVPETPPIPQPPARP